jgi:N-acetylglucosaminyl-diphospho-decaprenol L-rhamnosyltransferase
LRPEDRAAVGSRAVGAGDPATVMQGRHNGPPTPGPAIVLVTYNSGDHLRQFFPRQIAVASELGLPVVVIDNGSRDGSADLVREWGNGAPNVRVLENPLNRGYAAAVNQAFAIVPGQDVFLMNPDIELGDPAELTALREVLARNPRAGVVAPRLLNGDGSLQASARRFPDILAMAGHSSVARRLAVTRRASERYLAIPNGDGGPCRVEWAIGAAMLIRREAYEDVGGFDERFFLYLEDTDFCLRCAEEGWETWYVPSVALRHLHPRASKHTRGTVYSSAARRQHVISMVRFFAKYPYLIRGR